MDNVFAISVPFINYLFIYSVAEQCCVFVYSMEQHRYHHGRLPGHEVLSSVLLVSLLSTVLVADAWVG